MRFFDVICQTSTDLLQKKMSLSANLYMFVGCYTRKMGHTSGLGKGISIYKFNTRNGEATYMNTINASDCGPNPAVFYINNETNCIYICNECSDQTQVTQVNFNPEQNFSVTKQVIYNSYGLYTNAISSDIGRNNIYITNFGDPFEKNAETSVVVFKINKNSNLTPMVKDVISERGTNAFKNRQEFSHFHYILPCNRNINKNEFYATDLGRDKMVHYKITNDNKVNVISEVQTKIGGGARHFCFNPIKSGFLYLSLEFACAIQVIEYDKYTNKLLRVVQTVSSLPNNVKNEDGLFSTSHIQCDKTGKYLYCANRFLLPNDLIVCYQINDNGLLDESNATFFNCHGQIPRYFEIDPTNNFMVVANQEGEHSNIAIFRINHNKNGALEFLRCIGSGSPSFVQFATFDIKSKSYHYKSKL
eukprot:447579_1